MFKIASRASRHARRAAIPAAAALLVRTQNVGAQTLANQSMEERLNAPMRVIDGQQRQTHPPEQQIAVREMSRRGRGLSNAAQHLIQLQRGALVHRRFVRQQPDAARPGHAARRRQMGRRRNARLLQKNSASVAYTIAIEPQSKTQAPGQGWHSASGSESMASTLNSCRNDVADKHLTIDESIRIGLTPDAPNFEVGVRLPYTF
jgi:hypothetical protein